MVALGSVPEPYQHPPEHDLSDGALDSRSPLRDPLNELRPSSVYNFSRQGGSGRNNGPDPKQSAMSVADGVLQSCGKNVGVHVATSYFPSTLHLSNSPDSHPIKVGFFASKRSRFIEFGNSPHCPDMHGKSYNILIPPKVAPGHNYIYKCAPGHSCINRQYWYILTMY